MQRLEVSGAARPIYESLGVKRLMCKFAESITCHNTSTNIAIGIYSIFHSILPRSQLSTARLHSILYYILSAAQNHGSRFALLSLS